MKPPHAIVSLSYPIEGEVADIIRRCADMGHRSRRLRDLLVQGAGAAAVRVGFETDMRIARRERDEWMRLAYSSDHMNGHADLGPGGPCPLCKALDEVGE